MGERSPKDCPRLPESISNVIRPSRTIPSMSVGNISYIVKVRVTLGHSLDRVLKIFFKTSDSTRVKNIGKSFLAMSKKSHTFNLPSIFRVSIITPGACVKFQEYSIDLPSAEVHLNNGLKDLPL